MAGALRALAAYRDIADAASVDSYDRGAPLLGAQLRLLRQDALSSSTGIALDTATEPSADASTSETLDLRIAAIFVIFAGALMFGLIPIFLKYFERQDALFARLLRIFSGGVILALALVHIIPDAIEEVDGLVDYPLGGIAILVGIMILVVIDNSLAAFFTPRDANGRARHGHSHGHSHSHSHGHGGHAKDLQQHYVHAHSHDSLLNGVVAGAVTSGHSHSHKHVHGGSLNGHTHMHMDPHMQQADIFEQQQQQQEERQHLEEQHEQQQEDAQHIHLQVDEDVEAATAKAAAEHEACSTAHQRHGHHIHAHAEEGLHAHGHGLTVLPHAHDHAHGEEDGHTHQCMRSINAKHWVSSVASGQVTDVRQYVTAYTMELGCIFHSIIIGIGMGVIVNDRQLVATLMIALTVHQGLEGLSLASVLALTPFSRTKRVLMLLMYSITTPLGIAVGIAISSTYDPETRVARGVQGTLNGVSGGMLLYIAMYQLIGEELSREDLLVKTGLRLAMYGTLMLGSAAMCALAVWT